MANFFKEQRERLGISQRGIATLLGVSNTAVSMWEAGTSYPAGGTPIAKLAEVYEVSEDRMAKEVIALRRAFEDRKAEAASAK